MCNRKFITAVSLTVRNALTQNACHIGVVGAGALPQMNRISFQRVYFAIDDAAML